MTKQISGFTVIELIFAIVILSTASIIFFVQKNNIEIVAQDDAKKTAINSMYYALEKVFYKENGYYPQSISDENLRSVDPTLFTDLNGIKLGQSGCAYSYIPTDCTDGKCQKYTLRADLAKEDDYEKTNAN